MKKNKNFFMALGIADIERIHSQFLYWFFKENSIPDEIKSRVLSSLLGKEGLQFTEFDAETEFKNIDIVIKTKGTKIYIENKIKSIEHVAGDTEELQTMQYDKIIDIQNDPIPEKNIFRLFLSLTGGQPASSKWIARTYSDLYHAFDSIETGQLKTRERVLIQEYTACIGELTEAYDAFIQDPQLYENVFKAKMLQIEGADPWITFIHENKLKTIFQFGFYHEVMLKLSALSKKNNIILHNYTYTDKTALPEKNREYNYHFDNSNGTVLLHIDVAYFKYSGKVYAFGFQYQGGTYKINCQRPGVAYNKSEKKEIQFMYDIFSRDALFDNGKYRLNEPKSKAYISRSHTLPSSSNKTKKNISEFAKELFRELENAITIISLLKKETKKVYDSVDFF